MNFSEFAIAVGKVYCMVKVDALDSSAGALIFASFVALGSSTIATTFFSLMIRCLHGAARLGKIAFSVLSLSASSSPTRAILHGATLLVPYGSTSSLRLRLPAKLSKLKY